MSRARPKAGVAIEFVTCRCIGASPARPEASGYGKRFELNGVSFTEQPLAHQKTVGRAAQARVMVKAAPVAALVVVPTELGLELLSVSLDSPSTLCVRDH